MVDDRVQVAALVHGVGEQAQLEGAAGQLTVQPGLGQPGLADRRGDQLGTVGLQGVGQRPQQTGPPGPGPGGQVPGRGRGAGGGRGHLLGRGGHDVGLAAGAGTGVCGGQSAHERVLPRRPRAARLLISAPIPKVQPSIDSLCRTRLTSVPNRGEEMRTMSSTWWVNPWPTSSRSSTGANIVPRYSTNPSG